MFIFIVVKSGLVPGPVARHADRGAADGAGDWVCIITLCSTGPDLYAMFDDVVQYLEKGLFLLKMHFNNLE